MSVIISLQDTQHTAPPAAAAINTSN